MTSICINPVVVQDQEEEVALRKDTTCSEILVMIVTTTTDLHQTMACVRAAQERGSMITTIRTMVAHHLI